MWLVDHDRGSSSWATLLEEDVVESVCLLPPLCIMRREQVLFECVSEDEIIPAPYHVSVLLAA